MMYIKNRRERNYDRLLKTDLCKLLWFREPQKSRKKLLLFSAGLREKGLSRLFTVVCSCHCSNDQRLRKRKSCKCCSQLGTVTLSEKQLQVLQLARHSHTVREASRLCIVSSESTLRNLQVGWSPQAKHIRGFTHLFDMNTETSLSNIQLRLCNPGLFIAHYIFTSQATNS